MTQSVIDIKERTSTSEIRSALSWRGWVLLRAEDYDLADFSELMHNLCPKLTFDPAREYANSATQKVDAGSDAVGLHVENGNTPMPPDIVAFHSQKSARIGSQTTVCDGAKVYAAMPEELRILFSMPMTVSRYLPASLWQKYVATALALDSQQPVTEEHLYKFLALVPGQSAKLEADGGIDYCLQFKAIRDDNLTGVPAFANALLGPSYNYQAPQYRFQDGSLVDQQLLDALANLCERFTQEIQWQDGDVAVIDNKRCMHGRREILVPLAERQLNIGMGIGFNF